MPSRWRSLLRASLGIALALVTIAASGRSQDEPNIDPFAMDVVQGMCDYLAQSPFLSFRAHVVDEGVVDTGERLHVNMHVDVVARRPDGFWVKRDQSIRQSEIWFNGSTATVYNLPENLYATADVGDSIEEALDLLFERYGTTPPLSEFIRDDPGADLLGGVVTAYYEGLQLIDGVACHHVLLSGEELDWQLWIDTGLHLVPRKFVVTYKQEDGIPQYTAYLRDWGFHAVPAARFEPLIPPEARQIDFLSPMAN